MEHAAGESVAGAYRGPGPGAEGGLLDHAVSARRQAAPVAHRHRYDTDPGLQQFAGGVAGTAPAREHFRFHAVGQDDVCPLHGLVNTGFQRRIEPVLPRIERYRHAALARRCHRAEHGFAGRFFFGQHVARNVQDARRPDVIAWQATGWNGPGPRAHVELVLAVRRLEHAGQRGRLSRHDVEMGRIHAGGPHTLRETNAGPVVAHRADEGRARAQPGHAHGHVGGRTPRTDPAGVAHDAGFTRAFATPVRMARDPHPDIEVPVPHGKDVQSTIHRFTS